MVHIGSGYIALFRQIQENPLYFSEKFTKIQAFIDLLLLASFVYRIVFIRGIEIKLQPGELCYSQKTLAHRWTWNVKSVKKFLDYLEKLEMISYSGDNLTTLIRITNWTKYQITPSNIIQKNCENLQNNGLQNFQSSIGEECNFIAADGDQSGEQKERRTETNNKVYKENKILNEQLFDKFWKEYPKKTDKKESKEIFLKICKTKVKFDEISNGLKKLKLSESWTKENGKFVPSPARFLKKEKWNDETSFDIVTRPVLNTNCENSELSFTQKLIMESRHEESK